MGKVSREAAREAGFEDDEVLEGDPRSRLTRIAVGAAPLEQIQLLEALGGRANVMRICELSSKSAESGIGR